MTSGEERRRFIYKSDSVDALIKFFEGSQQSAEIAGSEWVTIRQVGEEIARQLSVEFEPGLGTGSEVMIDPKELLPGWQPRVNLSDGVARVIDDARKYLSGVKSSEKPANIAARSDN